MPDHDAWAMLSGNITKKILHVPRVLQDEFEYRKQFRDRAKLLFNNKEAIAEMYTKSPGLLERDLKHAQIIEQDLESIAQNTVKKWSDRSVAKQNAKIDLPYVKKYNKMLQEYAASLSTK